MKPNLEELKLVPRTGREPFRNGRKNQGYKLIDFWRWLASDLVVNTMRGRLAEYIVVHALKVKQRVRKEWAEHDLVTPEGIRVEVKSAAYLQSWNQYGELLTIQFDVEKTRKLNQRKGGYHLKHKRHSDVYVFASLTEQDKSKVDPPLNLNKWDFYVISTAKLNRKIGDQQKISLNPLAKLTGPFVKYRGLRSAVLRAAKSRKK